MPQADRMKISIIGAGRIGKIIAEHFSKRGHDVFIANSRGPETLTELAAEIGAAPVTVLDAARLGSIVIITIPQRSVEDLPKNLFTQTAKNTVVIDTCNYYPTRDGNIPEIDAGLTDSQWVEQQVGRPVVKAFNNITFVSLAQHGLPTGIPHRIALSIAGDDPAAKASVMELIDSMGFDPLDAGPLADSWRQQPGTPAYCNDLDLEALKVSLSEAEKDKVPAYREVANEFARRFIAGEVTLP